MSDFAGIIRNDGGEVSPAAAKRLAGALQGTGQPRLWRPGPAVALAERRGIPSYDNGAARPPIQRDEHRHLLVTARLDDPRGVGAALALEGSDPPDDRTLVAAACLRWGTVAAAERLYGEFAIAEWDARARRLILARDALGSRPIFYVVQSGMILFATTLQALMALPETPRDLDDVIIAHTLTIAMQDQEQTIYRHIRRAPPGGSVVIEDGRVRVARYFTVATIRPVMLSRDDDYVEMGRALLDRAVACRLSPTGRNGTFLSGGFDSTGVAATAARLLGGDPLIAFTRVAGAEFPDRDFDEGHLAGLVAARYANIDWRKTDDLHEAERDLTPEVEAGAMLVPRSGSFNGSWFESIYLAVQASGVDVVLNGGVGNNTLSWDGQPGYADRLKKGQLGGLARDLRWHARSTDRSVAGTAAHAMRRTLAPRAVRRWWQERRRGGAAPWHDFSLVSPDFLNEIGYDRHMMAAGHDIPFDPPITALELRLRMLQGQRGRDMAAFARNRWRASSRDPYLDRALVEFTLGVPNDQYWRDGTSRWLARRVLADRVPREILQKRNRGKQSPEWFFVASGRREGMAAAIDRLSTSRTAARVLDIPRMRALLDDWPKDADAAVATEGLHGHALMRAIAMGGFLRAMEGGNE